MTMPRRAMVLAAGLGTRMRPLTLTCPKPLLEVAGRSLLDHALDRLAAAHIETAVVNTHYLAVQIAPVLEARAKAGLGPRTLVSHEPELLDTGGGVQKALSLLGPDPFFVTSADILWFDGAKPELERLAAAWDEARMDVLLLLVPMAKVRDGGGLGDYHQESDGRLRRRSGAESAEYLYASVQLMHPRLFKDAPDGPFSNLILYDRAQAAGRLFGLVHDGDWYHLSTPQALAEVQP